MNRVLRFAITGVIGFATDAAVLWLLLSATPIGPFVARVLSIGLAMTTTWAINRRVTFRPSSRGAAAEGARYGGVGISAGIFNYLVYSGLLLALPGLPPHAALVAASLAAMALSYFGYSRLVFDR